MQETFFLCNFSFKYDHRNVLFRETEKDLRCNRYIILLLSMEWGFVSCNPILGIGYRCGRVLDALAERSISKDWTNQ